MIAKIQHNAIIFVNNNTINKFSCGMLSLCVWRHLSNNSINIFYFNMKQQQPWSSCLVLNQLPTASRANSWLIIMQHINWSPWSFGKFVGILNSLSTVQDTALNMTKINSVKNHMQTSHWDVVKGICSICLSIHTKSDGDGQF